MNSTQIVSVGDVHVVELFDGLGHGEIRIYAEDYFNVFTYNTFAERAEEMKVALRLASDLIQF
jgi:hypothetical protein